MITATAIFLITVLISLAFVCFGEALRFGVVTGFILLSLGIIGFLTAAFWIPIAFAYSAACLFNIGLTLYGMSFWSFRRPQIVGIFVSTTFLALFCLLL